MKHCSDFSIGAILRFEPDFKGVIFFFGGGLNKFVFFVLVRSVLRNVIPSGGCHFDTRKSNVDIILNVTTGLDLLMLRQDHPS